MGEVVNILQRRYRYGEDFTLSHLFLEDESFPGCPYILEDAVREIPGKPAEMWKVPKETAIPVGRYRMRKTWSTRWSKMMWEIIDVPGFAGIRPHAGNTSHHTEGCPITGRERDEKHGEVSGSRAARDVLYARLDAAEARSEEIWWTVAGLPD